MRRPVKITTPFPTVWETARSLGVSRRDLRFIVKLAERTWHDPATAGPIRVPAKKVVKFKSRKLAGAALPSKRK